MPRPKLHTGPPSVKVGKLLNLRSLRDGAREFGTSLCAMTHLCKILHVPILTIGHDRYYNEVALELAIFTVTFLDSPGLTGPGSVDKQRGLATRDNLPPVALPPDFYTSAKVDRAVDIYMRLSRIKTTGAVEAAKAVVRRKDNLVDNLLGTGPELAAPVADPGAFLDKLPDNENQ